MHLSGADGNANVAAGFNLRPSGVAEGLTPRGTDAQGRTGGYCARPQVKTCGYMSFGGSLAGVKDALVGAVGRSAELVFHERVPEGPPSSIVVIKPCCLGDVLMTTPVIAALREAFPKARITYAVGPWSRPAIENNPHLDQLIDCATVGSGRRYPQKEFGRLIGDIKAGKFDWCFVLDRSPVVATLPMFAGIKDRIGLDSSGRGFPLTVRVEPQEGRHDVETYLDTVRAVGIEPADPRLAFYPTANQQAAADRMLATIGPGGPLVAVNPGGGQNPGMTLSAKRWPAERYAALADRLGDAGARVVLVGGPSDLPVAQYVAALTRHPLADLTGRMAFGELGAFIQRCRLFVGNDSGATHLAVAVGAPVVAVFGPTDPRTYGPYRLGEAVSAGVPCSPCFLAGRFPPCRHELRCINEVSIEQVWAAVQRQMVASPAPR